MKKWLILAGIVAVAAFPVKAFAEYAQARAESTVVANNGQVVISHVVSSATGGGRLQKRIELRQNLQEKIQVLRATWQEKLQLIKDTRKKAILEKINDRICQVNQNRTTIMNRHLDNMGKILDRVDVKADEAKNKGKDISAVEAAVATARQKINDARDAVAVQAGKTCTINISGSEDKLGQEVRTAVKSFGNELAAVHQKIKDARAAVVVAIQKLAAVLGDEVPPKIKEGE